MGLRRRDRPQRKDGTRLRQHEPILTELRRSCSCSVEARERRQCWIGRLMCAGYTSPLPPPPTWPSKRPFVGCGAASNVLAPAPPTVTERRQVDADQAT